MTRIHFDHAATSPTTVSALDAMREHLLETVGNPSSVHLEGQRARAVVEESREELAAALGVDPDEIVFCSSGTEADNLALKGAAWAASAQGRSPHLVTSSIEHDAVRRSARWLEAMGHARVSWVDPERTGRVSADALVAAIEPGTTLVSLMAVNNETGVVQPVREVADTCRARGVPLHVDAVQATGRGPVRPDELGAELVTLSAHKVGGPRGLGVLVVRRGVEIQPLVTGGAQEGGLRAGTEAVAAIAGGVRALVDAIEASAERREFLRRLTAELEAGLARLPGTLVHGHGTPRAPGFTLVSFDGVSGEAVIQALDLAGFAVSAGSACTSGSTLPSHVLEAMGVDDAVARAAVRFSLAPTNRFEEIEAALAVLPAVVSACRARVAG